VITLLAALALTAPPPFPAFGIGAKACALALSGEDRPAAYAWVMGYFSGVNAGAQGAVGATGDGDAIMAEVSLTCQRQPALALIEAAETTYLRMREAGQ
jgi:hypothetical protein